MKKLSVLCAALFCISTAFSQKAKIYWGDEFKMHNGSTDLDVIYADNTGVYLQESHMALKSYFVIGATTRESATLIKLDRNLSEQYRNDFNKELRGKEFEEFFILQNKMYILASDYTRSDKTLTLYAAEVDKSNGNILGEWQSLVGWQKDEKSDNIKFKMSYSADSTKVVMVSSIEGKDHGNYQVQEFDKNLKPSSKPINISNEFDPKTFQLEDVIFTTLKKVVLVGRVYAYEDGKKKKDKYLDFSNYTVRIYDEAGKQLNEIKTDIDGKWLISTKVVQQRDQDLVLAAFYSNVKKGDKIDGMLVERIDPNTGNVITTSQKDINTSLIPMADDDNDTADDATDEDSKKEQKERQKLRNIKDASEGFSRYMQFRNIFYTADNGLVILAEKYHHYVYTDSYYTMGGFGGGYWTNTTYWVYESGDLMMCKVDAGGNINWLQVLPKAQKETISSSSGSYVGFSIGFDYFGNFNRPFYSGFGALQSGNTVNIFFNDNTRNATVTQLGQKVKIASVFRKADCYNVSLDVMTGKYTRNQFFSNGDVPTSMPRLGSVIGSDMYIVGKQDRMFGKAKIAVAKISVAG